MKLSLVRTRSRLQLLALAAVAICGIAMGCSNESTDPDSDAGGAGGSVSTGGSDAASGGAGQGTGGTATGGGNGGDLGAVEVNSPEDLTTASASDYDDNEFGVVSGSTLDAWIEDWESNRPAGITGRLIILQQDSTDGVTEFIKHDDENVFTYGFAQYAYADAQRRNNGLLDTFATIPDGEKTDEILNEFGIDLTKDLVVFAFADKDAVTPGAAVTDANKATKVWYNTRSWWWLRYWGADASHLAILDGAAKVVLDEGNVLAEPASTPPAVPGTFSVKQLRVDNTSLKIDVGELIDLVKEGGDDLVLVDPRRSQEYTGEDFASPANPVNGKRPVTEGRVKGARFLPWQATLQGVTIGDDHTTPVTAAVANGLLFKSKAALLALYNDDDYADYDGAADGAVTVHYCGHGRRASTWAFISLGVLGLPARLYDGSWVEWGNLAGGTALEGDAVRPLSEGSPWRTDLATLSEHGLIGEEPTAGVNYNPDTGAPDAANASAEGLNIDAAATSTSAIIDADKAYKLD